VVLTFGETVQAPRPPSIITVPLVHSFTGSWVADNVVVPFAGRWQLQVTVLTDPITEVMRTFSFTVYG
jgi:hypothetical protein